MGYRITYEPVKKVRGAEKRHSSAAALAGIFFLLFVRLVNLFWPRGAAALRELALPGDGAVTAAALEDFAEDLGSGLPISEAAEDFCRRILAHGTD